MGPCRTGFFLPGCHCNACSKPSCLPKSGTHAVASHVGIPSARGCTTGQGKAGQAAAAPAGKHRTAITVSVTGAAAAKAARAERGGPRSAAGAAEPGPVAGAGHHTRGGSPAAGGGRWPPHCAAHHGQQLLPQHLCVPHLPAARGRSDAQSPWRAAHRRSCAQESYR